MADLSVGLVVRRLPSTRLDAPRPGTTVERGMVVWMEGRRNHLSHDGALAPVKGEVVIRLGAGHRLYTTYRNEWEPVPPAEWTAEERVWSAHATYQFPDWYDEGSRVSDNDTYEWALMRALLPPHHLTRVFPEDGDWPCDWMEFAVAVAQCQDFDAAAAVQTFS